MWMQGVLICSLIHLYFVNWVLFKEDSGIVQSCLQEGFDLSRSHSLCFCNCSSLTRLHSTKQERGDRNPFIKTTNLTDQSNWMCCWFSYSTTTIYVCTVIKKSFKRGLHDNNEINLWNSLPVARMAWSSCLSNYAERFDLSQCTTNPTDPNDWVKAKEGMAESLGLKMTAPQFKLH